MLTKFVSTDQGDWDQKLRLSFLMLAYRSSEHESTGYSQNLMIIGRETELTVDLLYGRPPENRQDMCQYVTDMNLASVHCSAREKLTDQKRSYDHRTNQHSYNTGDLVWLQTKRKRALIPKLQVTDQKRSYDHRTNQHSYNTGDLVWLQTKRKRALISKLQLGGSLSCCAKAFVAGSLQGH